MPSPLKTIRQHIENTGFSSFSVLSGIGSVVSLFQFLSESRRAKARHDQRLSEPKSASIEADEAGQRFSTTDINKALTSSTAPTANPWEKTKQTRATNDRKATKQTWTQSSNVRHMNPDFTVRNPNFTDRSQTTPISVKDHGSHIITENEENQKVTMTQPIFGSDGKIDSRQLYNVQNPRTARAQRDLRQAASNTLRGSQRETIGHHRLAQEQANDVFASVDERRATRAQRWAATPGKTMAPVVGTPVTAPSRSMTLG